MAENVPNFFSENLFDLFVLALKYISKIMRLLSSQYSLSNRINLLPTSWHFLASISYCLISVYHLHVFSNGDDGKISSIVESQSSIIVCHDAFYPCFNYTSSAPPCLLTIDISITSFRN